MISWTQRRKLPLLIIFTILVIWVFAYIFYIYGENKTGRDDALFNNKNLSILWTRFFEAREGFIDVASLVQNPNNFAVEKLEYSFKIYDKNNILIAIKEGETFAGPLEKFVIFEPNIAIRERIAGRVVIDIQEIIFKQNAVDLRPKIDILGTERFLEDIFPRVVVNVKNREEKSLENVQSTIILLDEKQNAIAISRTQIPFLGISEERLLNFTWSKALNNVFSTEVFFRQTRE